MPFQKPPVVIDNGSRYIKAGFACDNHPVSMFRTVVARPKDLSGKYGYGRSGDYDVFIGDEAVARTKDMVLNSPVVGGRVVHWDNMERIWHHILYRELKVAPEDRSVLLACSPDVPMTDKIRCCEVFFEVLNVPALCIQSTAALALYGSGLTTGITVDIGYDSTKVNPVYEGGGISYAQMCTGYAGRQVCDFFIESLANREIDLGCEASEMLDQVMKDSLYVTPDVSMSRRGFERSMKTGDEEEDIDISQESFMASEIFFQPDLVMGRETGYKSLTECVVKSSLKCDSELRSEMYNGIVLSGGLSMIPGLAQRLQVEVTERLEKPVTVIPSDESYVVSWMGGACFAGIQDAQRLWITKKQYEDNGEKIQSRAKISSGDIKCSLELRNQMSPKSMCKAIFHLASGPWVVSL